MTSRPFQRADYAAIKLATHAACEDAKPLHRFCANTRPNMDPGSMSRYGSLENPSFIPLDVAMDLDAVSGGDRILKAWAKIRGYDLVKDELNVAIESLESHIGSVGKEVGDVISGACEAIAARRPITPARAKTLLKEVRESEDAHERLADDLVRIVASA